MAERITPDPPIPGRWRLARVAENRAARAKA